MKDINLANSIASKRREKGISQEELAKYIGVSKASVSKWETGQSYPDITFLPRLATYFNISIDMLMGYSPQMTKEDIKKLYQKLASDFVVKPFDDVMDEIDRIIKEYYSCFPLLLQIAVLLMNHHMLAPEKERQTAILNRTIEMLERIVDESGDVRLSNNALRFKIVCNLMLGKPEVILEILGDEIYPSFDDAELIARAYMLMGNIKKAQSSIQIAIYQDLIMLMAALCNSIAMYSGDIKRVDIILERAIGIGDLFCLDSLHPNTMANLYFLSAQIYFKAGDTDKALELLERYKKVCIEDLFPFTLHGDSFFDMLDEWFDDFDLGPDAVRDERAVKKDIIKSVEENPAFKNITDNCRFKNILNELKENLGCE